MTFSFLKPYLLLAFLIPISLHSQRHQLSLSLGLDNHPLPYLDDFNLTRSPGQVSAFKTLLDLTYQSPERGGKLLHRTHFSFAFGNAYNDRPRPYKNESVRATDFGLQFSLTQGFGVPFQFLEGKLLGAAGMGFGIGIHVGGSAWPRTGASGYTEAYWDWGGFSFNAEGFVTLDYRITRRFHAGLEQRHEAVALILRMTETRRPYPGQFPPYFAEKDHWTTAQGSRYANYMPPLLRLSLVFN